MDKASYDRMVIARQCQHCESTLALNKAQLLRHEAMCGKGRAVAREAN